MALERGVCPVRCVASQLSLSYNEQDGRRRDGHDDPAIPDLPGGERFGDAPGLQSARQRIRTSLARPTGPLCAPGRAGLQRDLCVVPRDRQVHRATGRHPSDPVEHVGAPAHAGEQLFAAAVAAAVVPSRANANVCGDGRRSPGSAGAVEGGLLLLPCQSGSVHGDRRAQAGSDSTVPVAWIPRDHRRASAVGSCREPGAQHLVV
jgi:hypothetical protein